MAYYLDGYLTALIDGHHKAFAAALEHRDVNAPRTLEMAEFFTRRNRSPKAYRSIFRAVMKLPRTEPLEQFLIDKMVELEGKYPSVGKLILDYL